MTYVNAPVHDLLIRIKNAYMARRTTVDGVVYSKFKANILELLKQYGFVKDFSIQGTDAKKVISIELKKVVNPVNDIPSVKFFSKPSRPWYVGYKDYFYKSGSFACSCSKTKETWWRIDC